jgi:hypothetical protein
VLPLVRRHHNRVTFMMFAVERFVEMALKRLLDERRRLVAGEAGDLDGEVGGRHLWRGDQGRSGEIMAEIWTVKSAGVTCGGEIMGDQGRSWRRSGR